MTSTVSEVIESNLRLRSEVASLRRVVESARTWSDERGGCDNPDVPATCINAPDDEPRCFWCQFVLVLQAHDAEWK